MAEMTDQEAIDTVASYYRFFSGFSKLDQLVTYITNARKDFPDLQAKLDALDAQIHAKQQEAQTTLTHLAQVQADTAPVIQDLLDQKDRLEAAVSALQKAQAVAQQGLDATEQAVQVATTTHDQLRDQVAALTEQETSLAARVTDLQTKLDALRQQAADLVGAA